MSSITIRDHGNNYPEVDSDEPDAQEPIKNLRALVHLFTLTPIPRREFHSKTPALLLNETRFS